MANASGGYNFQPIPISEKGCIFADEYNYYDMTALEIRTAINNDLNTFSPDLLKMVADYVRSLRKRSEATETPITPLVASIFTGHSLNISDIELDTAREAYLKEKYL